MTVAVSPSTLTVDAPSAGVANRIQSSAEASQRFEQMVWEDMLKNAGFEKTLTQGGGEGAAAFARFMIEAIAEELSVSHPLGLSDGMNGVDKAAPTETTPDSKETDTHDV